MNRDARAIAADLEPVVERARQLAGKLGLDGYPVKYWIVDYDEMNRLIARDGFPTRYPHWRWGMQYDRQRKESRYGGSRAFEIVVNDDPAHAYLQESNASADQKAVITHVEAHADFFRHNRWFHLFDEGGDAVRMLERHAEQVRAIVDDPAVDRDEVERFMDSALAIADTIDQHRAFEPATDAEPDEGDDPTTADGSVDADAGGDPLAGLDVSEEIERAVFGEWEAAEPEGSTAGRRRDVLAFLRRHGKQYDEATGRAVEMDDWQRTVLEIVRREAYYFAPQRMTKVMNEGWAAYWESLMMGEEAFAGDDEFLRYADHQSKVLGSPGLNPYKLGKELWEYLENRANRREVVGHLLRVEGITWENFHDVVDTDRVRDLLAPPAALDAVAEERLDDLAALDADADEALVDRDALARARDGEIDLRREPWAVLTYEGLARRHYALCKPQNRGFLGAIGRTELERIDRYQFDDDRYADLEAALAHVDFTAGWDRMYEVRESHNDVTFLQEFLTAEFVRRNDYFTYEHSHATGGNRVASTDPEDVTRKLLVQFANFGKPTVTVEDGNFRNRNELLLAHQYNGIQLDVDQALDTLERVFDLWGRPVNLKTITKEVDADQHDLGQGREPAVEEQGRLLRYDGTRVEVEDLDWEAVEDIAATEVDYDTRPDDWL